MQQIHNYKDSDGNRIVFTFLPDKLETEPADNYTFYVKYAVPEEEVESLPIQDFAGKYLCVEMTSDGKDMTDFVKSAWADKSFYEYIVIAEDGKLTLYAYQGGTTNELSNVDIKAITQDSVIFASGETWKIEDGKIIAEASNSKMVFERNDDIPES